MMKFRLCSNDTMGGSVRFSVAAVAFVLLMGGAVGCSRDDDGDKNSEDVPDREDIDVQIGELSGRCSDRQAEVEDATCAEGAITCDQGCTAYVSADGSDANDGSSPDAAFQTVSHALEQSLAGGATLCLRRGDVFREVLTFPIHSYFTAMSPFTLQSYGDSDLPRPVLSGATRIDGGFSPGAGGVFEVDLSDILWEGEPYEYAGSEVVPHSRIYQLFVDGKPLVLARFPNIGDGDSKTFGLELPDGNYSLIDGVSGNTYEDNELPSANFVGAALHHKASRWTLRTEEIVGQNATSVTTASPLECSNETCLGYGYFVNDARDALDAAGEWYFDPQSKILSVIPPADVDLNTAQVEASTYREHVKPEEWESSQAPKRVFSTGIDLQQASHVNIRDLAFEYYSGAGVTAVSTITEASVDDPGATAGLHVEGCRFAYTGATGVNVARWGDMEGAVDARLTMNEFVGQLSHAAIVSIPESEVSCNNVEDIGRLEQFPRFGMYGSGQSVNEHGMAVLVDKPDIEVSFNRFARISSAAISFRAQNTIVAKNVIHDACLVKGDCGAVHTYTWSDDGFSASGVEGSVVAQNLIFDTWGTAEGAGQQHQTPLGQGLFLDFGAEEYAVQGNVIVRSSGSGILLSLNRNVLIEDNLLYANAYSNDWNYPIGQLQIVTSQPPTAAEVRDNVIFATAPLEIPLGLRDESISQAGTFEGNTYFDPFSFDSTSDSHRYIGYFAFVDGGEQELVGYHAREWEDASGELPAVADFYWHEYVTTPLGDNLLTNGDFSNGTTGWTTNEYAEVEVQVVTHPELGTALSYERNGGSGGGLELRSPSFDLEANKTYELRFWIAPNPSQEEPLSPRILINQTEWNFVPADRLREVSFVFEVTETQLGTDVAFDAYPLLTDGFTLADIRLREVSVTPSPARDVVRFNEGLVAENASYSTLIFNDTDKIQSAGLSGDFVGLDGSDLGESVDVPGFSGVVVLRRDATEVPIPN